MSGFNLSKWIAAISGKRSGRTRVRKMRRAALRFELLERRLTPTFSVTMAAAAVTFTGNEENEVLTLGLATGGLLSHNLSLGGNLVSTTDMDSTPGPSHENSSMIIARHLPK